jgi:hypothetical protein
MLLVAVARELRRRGHGGGAPAPIDLLEMVDMVALATVCDVVPLQGLNRAYVARGLEVLRRRRNVGLKALADAAGLAVPPTAYHLGFVLGPRINAGGRIGDAGLGARLLALADETEAARIAALLDKLNRERKAIETAMLEEAMVRADACLERQPDLPILIVASEGFHKGVVGLVWWSASTAQPASSPGRSTGRAPGRCAPSRASTSAPPCGRRWRRGTSARAAATPWPRACRWRATASMRSTRSCASASTGRPAPRAQSVSCTSTARSRPAASPTS